MKANDSPSPFQIIVDENLRTAHCQLHYSIFLYCISVRSTFYFRDKIVIAKTVVRILYSVHLQIELNSSIYIIFDKKCDSLNFEYFFLFISAG